VRLAFWHANHLKNVSVLGGKGNMYVDEKTKAKLNDKQNWSASMPYSILTTATLRTPLFFLCTLPLSVTL
jgi:hypothetical protein